MGFLSNVLLKKMIEKRQDDVIRVVETISPGIRKRKKAEIPLLNPSDGPYLRHLYSAHVYDNGSCCYQCNERTVRGHFRDHERKAGGIRKRSREYDPRQ